MGYLKGIAGTGVLLAAWICANAQTAPAQGRKAPGSVYYVETDYGWTMSSRESSGYYTFSSPLRMRMRISFADLGDGRLQMHLHFYEVSYTDQTHAWTITDFSDPEKIRERLNERYNNGAKLEHFTELAAFEEETLGYLMALSHGMTFVIDPSEDTSATFSNLQDQHKTLWTGSRKAVSGRAKRPPKVRNKRALAAYRRVLHRVQKNPRLAIMWTQQILDLAMFAMRPGYKTLTPCRATSTFYDSVNRLNTNGSPAESRTGVPEVPAFSLCGLYRWLPVHESFFAHLDSVKLTRGGNLGGQALVLYGAPGAWFVRTDKTYHIVQEDLDETSSGAIRHRRIKVESGVEEVDAFAILPDGRGIRGTINVTAKTSLEATLVTAAEARAIDNMEDAMHKIEDAVKVKDYHRAHIMCQAHLRAYPDAPQARQMRQRMDELAAMKGEREKTRTAMKAEREEKRIKNWTKLAELGLRNGRPDVARVWLLKIIREYPQTTWAANAQQRLSDLPPIAIPS